METPAIKRSVKKCDNADESDGSATEGKHDDDDDDLLTAFNLCFVFRVYYMMRPNLKQNHMFESRRRGRSGYYPSVCCSSCSET